MQRRQMLFTGALAGAATLLAGCGFHLRGEVPLPYRSLYVAGRDTPLLQLLRRAVGAHTQLAGSAAQAEAVLRVLSERQDQIAVIVDGNGNVAQVQLRLFVDFALDAQDGTPLIERNTLRLVRDVSYAESQALSKQSEFQLLYRDMRSDAANQIMRRVARGRPVPQ